MAESDDLIAQVENDPENHELRWRLSKRLYRTGDYRTALKHLQVLRGQWKPKINVARYLAATYYRLGRYDQSIAELEDAVEEWPDEIPLREQLARVFEVAERKERALQAWKKILDINPEHDLARQAITRLALKTPPHFPQFVPGLDDRDFGLDAGTGIICPNCGTLNTGDFDRCWKCNAYVVGKPAARSSEPEPASIDFLAAWIIVAKVVMSLLAVVAAWLALRQYVANGAIYEQLIPLTTTQSVLNEKTFLTRLILGGVILFVWPLAIWIGVTLSKAHRVELSAIIVTGMAFSAIFFAILWLPFFLTAITVPLLLALAVVPIMLFPARLGQRVIITIIQAVIVVCVVYLVVGLREGNSAVAAVPTLFRYSIQFDFSGETTHLFPPLKAPLKARINWESTGSAWLDSRAGRCAFAVSSPETDAELTVEILDGERSVYYGRSKEMPFKFLLEPKPGKSYQLLVDGSIAASLEITIHGMLIPRLEN